MPNSPIYTISYTKSFERKYGKLIRNNKKLSSRIDLVIDQLKMNPYSQPLKTHKVGYDKLFGELWSSRVTGDIRIIWVKHHDYNYHLVLINIGGHNDVY